MKTEQKRWDGKNTWEPDNENTLSSTAQLVLLFGSRDLIKNEDTFQEAKKCYPKANIIGCSTSGEIFNTQVTDNTLTLTAIEFKNTQIETYAAEIASMENSFAIGEQLAKQLSPENLIHVFVLSEGLNVNGSELVKGITSALPENVTITGGLSGDADKFEETYVIANKPGKTNTICVVGFYGSSLKVGYSSVGGWDSFGPERVVTKSKANILHELDSESALELYKTYLGEHADKLPASGLLFPLSIRETDQDVWVVRTLLAIDDKEGTLTFAGDVPEKSYARLMKANFDRLITGAKNAAKNIVNHDNNAAPDLAILISCVGRKMILKGRIEEETEAVRNIYGSPTTLTGFYSYGEISPFTPNAACKLHNQTMTITTFTET